MADMNEVQFQNGTIAVDGATHMDLYNHRVDEVVGKLARFFAHNLEVSVERELMAKAA